MTNTYINTRNRSDRMKRFWVCYVEGTNGGMHFRHNNLLSAQEEAERLARLPYLRGKTVYLLECIGKVCLPTDIKWEIARG